MRTTLGVFSSWNVLCQAEKFQTDVDDFVQFAPLLGVFIRRYGIGIVCQSFHRPSTHMVVSVMSVSLHV